MQLLRLKLQVVEMELEWLVHSFTYPGSGVPGCLVHRHGPWTLLIQSRAWGVRTSYSGGP